MQTLQTEPALPKLYLGSVTHFVDGREVDDEQSAYITGPDEQASLDIRVEGLGALPMAEMIVRAVNAHDALVAALELAYDVRDSFSNFRPDVLEAIRVALAVTK